MLGSPILYLRGMRILMFQLSGFYCRALASLSFRDIPRPDLHKFSDAPTSTPKTHNNPMGDTQIRVVQANGLV